jgi:hypothetical protein
MIRGDGNYIIVKEALDNAVISTKVVKKPSDLSQRIHDLI